MEVREVELGLVCWPALRVGDEDLRVCGHPMGFAAVVLAGSAFRCKQGNTCGPSFFQRDVATGFLGWAGPLGLRVDSW